MSLSLPGRWSRLFRRRPARGPVPARGRPTSCRPTFDHLEDRVVPTTFVWTGAGATPDWNNSNNWVGNVAPTPSSDLLFPGGAARMTTTFNNFSGGNAVFNSITIAAAGYAIQGNSGITLGAGGLTVNSATAGGSDSINIPIALGANLSITDTYAGNTLQVAAIDTSAGAYTVTFDGSGSINASAVITGAGGVAKNGPGTLQLQAANTYTGQTTINAGIVQLAGSGTLGTAGTGTTVNAGATLQLLSGVNTAEPLNLTGSGIGGGVANSTAAALEASGSNVITGAITLANDAAIGVDAGASLTDNSPAAVVLNGHTLTINSAGTATFNDQVITGTGVGGNLIVNAALTGGTVTLTAAGTFTGSTTVQAGTLKLSGAGGALASPSISVLQGATLSVDDTGQTTIPNRLPDTATVSLRGGTLKLTASASAATTERVGTITLAGGHSNVVVNLGAPNVLGRIAAANLVRSTGATVNFGSNQVLGGLNDQVVFTTVPITVGSNGGILPYATVGDTDFATYGANGIAAFSGYVTSLAAAGPNDIVKLTGGATTLAASKTVAGLVSAGNTLTINLGIALTIGTAVNGSGLLLRGAAINSAGSGTAAVNFAGEGFVFTNATPGASTVNVQLTGNRGVSFSGPTSAAAALSLNPGALGSGYTGGTYLDSTNVSLQGTNPLGAAAGPVNLVGGALTSAISGFTLANPVNLLGAVTTLNATNLTLTGLVTLTGSNAITFAQPTTITGKMTGTGSLTELGAATLVINPVVRNDYSGGTVLEQGTLIVSSPSSPLGTGPLTFVGGTLQSTVPGGSTLTNRLLFSAPPAGGANVTISGINPFTLTGPATLTGLATLLVNVPTTLTGLVSGSGSLAQAGTALLSLSGSNSYTGATMVEGGQVAINGVQPSSAVGVAAGTLSGAGTLGYLTVAQGGTDEPGNPGQALRNGVQTVPGANFSEGGNLTIQASGIPPFVAGTDYSRLVVGPGALILGGSAAAPATMTLDLAGLSAIGVATGAVLTTSLTGVTPVFQQLNIRNNANDFAASLNYTVNGVDLTFTTAVNRRPGVPATTKVWTGLSGGDTNLSDPANWLGNLAPAPGDDVIFPAGSAQLSLTNDFTSNPFGNITFEAGGYTLNGNPVTLQGDLTTTEPGNAVATTTTVNAPLVVQFGGKLKPTYPGTSLLITGQLTLSGGADVDGAGTTTLTGKITGGSGLTKDGTGTLNIAPLNGTASDYAGVTILNAGLTIISSGAALGSPNQGTTVNDGATLQTNGVLTLGEPLTLAGYGLGGNVPGNLSGALSATASLTLTGGVTLSGNALIDNTSTDRMQVTTTPWQLHGLTLTLNTEGLMQFATSINDGAGFSPTGSLIVNADGPAGAVSLEAANSFSGSLSVNEGNVTLRGNGTLPVITNIHLYANTFPAVAGSYPGPVGVLTLDDTGTNLTNRINDNAELDLDGGEWVFRGVANAATSETIGIIRVEAGHSIMREVPGPGPLAGLQLFATQFNENVGATVDFDAPPTTPLGNATNNLIKVNVASEPALDGFGILPYAVVTQSNGILPPSQVDFMTYDEGSHVFGVRAFTGYSGFANGANNGVVKFNNAPATVTLSTTFDAVLLNNSTLSISPGATVTVNNALLTGALRPNGSGIATINGGGALVFGNPAYVTRYEPTNLNTAITGGSVAYGGTALLQLAPNSASTYGGNTWINSGTVSVVNSSNVFGFGNINLYAGALSGDVALGGALALANPVTFNNSQMDFLPQGPFALTFSGPVTFNGGLSTLAIPQNLTLTISGIVGGGGGLLDTGGGVAPGAGTLVLTNKNNNYSGGTVLVNQGGAVSTLVLGSVNPLGTGPLVLSSGTLEASTAAVVTNPVTLRSANVTLGGPAPFNKSLTFAGSGVTVGGNSTLTASVPVEIDDTISDLGGFFAGSSGSLTLVGSFTLAGNPSTSVGNTTSSGLLQENGLANNSPVTSSGGSIYGSGTIGPISTGPGVVVQPGTPSAVGTLTAGNANFSNGGTLRLRINGYATPGVDYDVLDLGGNQLIVGGSSRLVLDLGGLQASMPGNALEMIKFGSRVGNMQLFNEVDVVNNPNKYSVELDYTTDPMTNQPVLNVVVAVGATDTPVLVLPASASTSEDIPLTFSSTIGNALTVSDVGAISPLQVTLSVTAGTGKLTLGATTGLTFTGGSNGSASMSFTGSAADVTAAFDGLVFTPASDFTGPAVMTLTVVNQGGFGLLGGARTNTATTTINVIPTTDSPTFTLAGTNVNASDNAGAQTYPGWALNVQGEPPNTGNLTGLFFTTTNDDPGIFTVQPKVTLTGNTGTLTFTPKPNSAGIATVTVTLSNTFPDLDGDQDSYSLTFTIALNNTNAPAVTDVIIHWGTESASLLTILNNNRDVPFQSVNAIDIVFNQDVIVQQSDLSLSGLSGLYGFTNFSYNPKTFTATWALASALGGSTGIDKINLTLDGTSANAVRGRASGVKLNGGVNYAPAQIKVLVGDVDGNGVVDLNDQLAIIRGLSLGYTGISFLDIDGNGHIDVMDYYFVRNYTGHKLP